MRVRQKSGSKASMFASVGSFYGFHGLSWILAAKARTFSPQNFSRPHCSALKPQAISVHFPPALVWIQLHAHNVTIVRYCQALQFNQRHQRRRVASEPGYAGMAELGTIPSFGLSNNLRHTGWQWLTWFLHPCEFLVSCSERWKEVVSC